MTTLSAIRERLAERPRSYRGGADVLVSDEFTTWGDKTAPDDLAWCVARIDALLGELRGWASESMNDEQVESYIAGVMGTLGEERTP